MNWIILSVLSNVTATFFLKISSTIASPSLTFNYSKIASLVAALIAYFFAFISYRQSLVSFQVGTAYALITSSTAMLVGLMGVLIFGDNFGMIKAIGFVLLCIGIILISITASPLNS